ncbi:MFS transporter [Caldivirga sp. UBA161]|uniref:MFS transporter n=1 Tax=Caldivirga sp. UBA161 TaxID=1915569 RepID=UPI0025C3EE62|nr:MFS transporter [Caldivirga sp. UBA161]
MNKPRQLDWDVIKTLDAGGLSKHQWLIIASASLGMFLWGILLALAPLTTQWPFVPKGMIEYILLSAPVALTVGNLTIGRLSDAYGRKYTFILTFALYSIGILLVLLANNAYSLIIGIALAEFGLGGEEPTALAYLAEMMPIKRREEVLIGVTNVANLGAAVAAALTLATGMTITLQREFFAITIGVALTIMLVTRLMIPESYRWMLFKHIKSINPINLSNLRLRLFVLVSLAITIVLTYALLALVMGPYLFPRLTSWIVLLYNIGETLGGIIGILMFKKISVKPFTLIAYLGGFITMLALIPQVLVMPHNLIVFLTLLLINGVFGELGWAARVILEPELFPTRVRSMGIAAVRASAYVIYIASIFFTAGFTLNEYLLYNAGLWGLGLVAALEWYNRGLETAFKPLEQINEENA